MDRLLCSSYQAVHDGTGFRSADGIHVDPVLSPEGEGMDGAFCSIVIHGNVSCIIKIPFYKHKLSLGIFIIQKHVSSGEHRRCGL